MIIFKNYIANKECVFVNNTDKSLTFGNNMVYCIIRKHPGNHDQKVHNPHKNGDADLNTLLGRVTGDGIKIKSIHPHAKERITQRGVWAKNILISIKEKGIQGNNGYNIVYSKNGTTVVVNKKTGQIVTAIYKGKKR